MRNILERWTVMQKPDEGGSWGWLSQEVVKATDDVKWQIDATLDIVWIWDKPEPPKKDVTRWGGDWSFDVV
jgi:hypothetical protein